MRVVRAVLLWFASVAPLREVVRLETAAPKGKPPAPSMPLLTGAVKTNGVSPGLRGFRNCGALLCSEKLHFLNDDVQRRTLHRADIHLRRVHGHGELPECMPGGVRQAKVDRKLGADAHGAGIREDHALCLAIVEQSAVLV